MKNILKILCAFLFLGSSFSLYAQPVISANGFQCGKENNLVTCKGPLPNGKDSIMGSGKDVVYLTINTDVGGVPSRYSYFSDTGCMVGYTFSAAGKPAMAVASHRSGEKRKIDLNKEGFEEVSRFCSSEIKKTANIEK
ncbi:MAG: hypothetical protein H7A32_00415 [Deltaproteobacteria bacterium]|nr:hypothetical protein [Deltaproteobacteria bacterium]